MSVQVLVAAMHQADHSLLEKMNIETDVIVGNQCDKNCIEVFEFSGHSCMYLNFSEKGVGLNRNNALMRATGDYCVFADDDVVFNSGYSDIIENAFRRNPKADVIIFNIRGRDRGRNLTVKTKKVGRLNYLRYGTVRIAIRLSSIRKKGIFFNLTFGGGTEHCHGEDNLFLNSCLNKGLSVIAVPDFIGALDENAISSWDNGYDDKFFRDQGVLYHELNSKMWLLLCAQDAWRRRKQYQKKPWHSFKLMTSLESRI